MPPALTNLRDSLAALSATLAITEDEERMAQYDAFLREGMRAGAIKQFEITYGLSWKLMKRWLNTNVTPGIADGVTVRQLFRLAAETRLIADVDVWMSHHEARNKTVHMYDGDVAASVYRAAREFVHNARSLLDALEARND